MLRIILLIWSTLLLVSTQVITNNSSKIIFSIGLLLFSTISHANFHCTVDVSKLLIYAKGSVNVQHTGRNANTVICNLSAERQGVSVTTCAMWTSMLQNIKKSGGKAIFYYLGNGTCADIATHGSAPIPVYIGDVE